MNTNVHDRGCRSDPDDARPDTSQLDWDRAEIGRGARKPGERTEVFADGAVAYQLRLIPSGKVLGRFASTLDAWPAIIAAAEGGRSPRTLAFDAIRADGSVVLVSAGPRLLMWARHNDGGPHPYPCPETASPRRVAEGVV